MMNLAINSSITKPSVSIWGKTEPAAETSKKTFQNVLETIRTKSALNKTPDLYSVNNYTFNAEDADDEIADEETLTKTTKYAEPEEPQVKILHTATMYAEYIEIEINGVKVKQVTDDFVRKLGRNPEILKANSYNADFDVNLLNHIDANGFIPKYVIPLDIGWDTDYKMTLVTPKNFDKMAENNAALDAGASKVVGTINMSRSNSYKPLGNLAKTAENNAASGFVASKAAVAVNNKSISQNYESPLKEVVKEDGISHNIAQKPSETMESFTKAIANNVAFKILSNLNILNIWDPKEKAYEKK